ncbi:MAG: hypothetical protein GY928_27010 [Colwellia sp.]|nr:hypothetical protein [Colwellia sp.]
MFRCESLYERWIDRKDSTLTKGETSLLKIFKAEGEVKWWMFWDASTSKSYWFGLFIYWLISVLTGFMYVYYYIPYFTGLILWLGLSAYLTSEARKLRYTLGSIKNYETSTKQGENDD